MTVFPVVLVVIKINKKNTETETFVVESYIIDVYISVYIYIERERVSTTTERTSGMLFLNSPIIKEEEEEDRRKS